MDAADPRTPAQQREAQAATARDAQAAGRLQQQRLRQEQAQRAANTPATSGKQAGKDRKAPRKPDDSAGAPGQETGSGKPRAARKPADPAADKDFKARVPDLQPAAAASSARRSARKAVTPAAGS